MTGKLIVLSAPSGAGKTTLYKALLKQLPDTTYSVSVTTRPKRKGEVHGRDYFFVTEAEFQHLIKNNEFIEYARVHNNWYGTRRSFIEKQLQLGKNILLDIDVQGAINIKQQMPKAILIFIMAPSMEELKKRLTKRGTDHPRVIENRLANAEKEIRQKDKFDYIFINDDLERCIKEIKRVLQKEALHEFS